MKIIEYLKEILRFQPSYDNEVFLDERPVYPDIELVKDMIEKRYRRISTRYRRPSIEYISSEAILEIFVDYVSDPDSLYKMSQKELQDFYDEWYENIYMRSELTPKG